MRTQHEIDEQLKKGEAFVKEHPQTMFGDDNMAQFNLFKRIIEQYKKYPDLNTLETFIDDAYDDDDRLFADDVVSWLRGESEDIY